MIELPLLSAGNAAELSGRVVALAEHWTRRHPIAPFFTLGAAAYIDAALDTAHYLRAKTAANPILKDQFKGLYNELADCLSCHLGTSVHLTDRFALPGFHIYLPFAAFRQKVASLHWDRQHALLPWGKDGEPAEVLSLTLPLSCPIGGCGLKVWRWRHDEGAAARKRHLADPGPAHEEYHYQAGHLLLHDGQALHQAQLMPNRPFGDAETEPPQDRRITLQAHLAKTDGAWELYW